MTTEHELIVSLKQKFEKVLDVVKDDMATVRVGRAKPDMVENLVVSAYGGKMRLVELASIAAPDPNMLLITPYDKSIIREIEIAISDSEMKLSGALSGESIRIVIPPLTQERRQDFVKLLKQKTESGKVMLRQARQDIREKIDELKNSKTVSEDEIYMLHEQLDKVTAEYNEKIESMSAAKEEEIMMI